MNKTPGKPFQFGLLDLLAVMLWAAIVLAAWRTGLSQPRLMPILIPLAAGIGVYALLFAAKRFSKRKPGE
jgi:hypothetical protein